MSPSFPRMYINARQVMQHDEASLTYGISASTIALVLPQSQMSVLSVTAYDTQAWDLTSHIYTPWVVAPAVMPLGVHPHQGPPRDPLNRQCGP